MNEGITLGWGVQPNASRGHVGRRNTESSKDLAIDLLAVSYHFSLSWDGIWIPLNNDNNLLRTEQKKFCRLLQEKYLHLHYPRDKGSHASLKRWQRTEEITARELSDLCVPRDPLRKPSPRWWLCRSWKEPFNLWTVTATQLTKAAKWSLSTTEVGLGRVLVYYHEVCPTHSARRSPQTEESSVTAHQFFTETAQWLLVTEMVPAGVLCRDARMSLALYGGSAHSRALRAFTSAWNML